MPPLPRFRAAEQRVADARKLARLLAEAGAEATPAVKGALPTGGDRARMRGFPIVGKGIRGTAPGTDPVGAMIGKESRRRR